MLIVEGSDFNLEIRSKSCRAEEKMGSAIFFARCFHEVQYGKHQGSIFVLFVIYERLACYLTY